MAETKLWFAASTEELQPSEMLEQGSSIRTYGERVLTALRGG